MTMNYDLAGETYAVVDVYTKRRTGNVSDVFAKYCNDAPIILGQVISEEMGGWAIVPDHGGEDAGRSNLARKRDGVYYLCREEGLKYFDAAHFKYGRINWRMKRIEVKS